MTQPDKTKVLPEKLFTDEINKQLNINTTTDSASNNENVVTMNESNEDMYPDVDCHLVRDVVLSLLDLHLTNVDVSNTSEDNNTDDSINGIDNTNLPDFSIVNNADQDNDSSSESSYDTDDSFVSTDDKDNHELDAKFYSV